MGRHSRCHAKGWRPPGGICLPSSGSRGSQACAHAGIFSLAGGVNVLTLGAEGVWTEGRLRKEVGAARGRECGRGQGGARAWCRPARICVSTTVWRRCPTLGGLTDRHYLTLSANEEGSRGSCPAQNRDAEPARTQLCPQVWDPGCIETSPGTSGGEVTSSTTDPNRT